MGPGDIIYLAHTYPHARGVKWAYSLRQRGWHVTVLAKQLALGTTWTVRDERVISLGRIVPSLYGVLVPANLRQVIRILEQRSVRPRLVLARDIRTAVAGAQLAKHYAIPWVLDICDNYPEVAAQLSRYGRGAVGRLGSLALARLEKWSVANSSMIVVTTPETRDLLARKAGRAQRVSEKIHVAHNAPLGSPNGVAEKHYRRPHYHRSNEPFRLVYIGTIDRGIRDLVTAVRGMLIAQERYGITTKLVLRTSSLDQARDILENDSHVNWKPLVEFASPVPVDELTQALQEYDVGLVPHCCGAALDTSLSNKIFDYLYAGLPVLASDNPPNRRLLREVAGGLTYRCEDAGSFAERLYELLSAGAQCSRSILVMKYHWEAQVAPALDCMSKLAGVM